MWCNGKLTVGNLNLPFESHPCPVKSSNVIYFNSICDTKLYCFSITGIICGPVLLFWTFIRGDLEMTINFPYLLSPGFSVIFSLQRKLFCVIYIETSC